MKWILRIGALVVVLIVAALFGAWLYIDTIAESAIEEGATYATGVPTTLGGASVGVFAGGLEIEDLEVANPEGFDADYFLHLGEGSTQVSLGSLMSDTVVIPHLRLSDLTVNLQQKGDAANYQVILDNLAKLSGDQAQPTDETKGYKVGQILIQNVTVNAEVMGQSIRDVQIPEIRLEDIGSDTETGVLLSELQGVIVKAVLEAIAKNPQALPGLMAAGLNQGLQQVGEIAKVGEQIIGDITTQAGQILEGLPGGQGLSEKLQGTGGKAGQTLEGATQKLGNFFGGNKKEKDEQPDQQQPAP